MMANKVAQDGINRDQNVRKTLAFHPNTLRDSVLNDRVLTVVL